MPVHPDTATIRDAPTSSLWRTVPLEVGRDRLLAHLWAQLMQPSAEEFRPSTQLGQAFRGKSTQPRTKKTMDGL